MARYIDADALIEYISKNVICTTKDSEECKQFMLEHLAMEFFAPTVDVAPRAEWISVDERLPDMEPNGKGRYGGARSVRVLCACKQRSGRTFTKEGYYEPCGNGKVFWRIPGSVDSVTHWMPLPEPPKGD